MLACELSCNVVQAAEAPLARFELASPFEEASPQQKALRKLSQALAETKGAALVVIPSARFGSSSSATLRAVQKGGLDLAIVPFEAMAEQLPAFSVLTTPYLFEDYRHLNAVQAGEPGRRLFDELRRNEVVGVGWWPGEFLAFAGKVPAASPGDLAGRSIAFQSAGPSLRARPTAIESITRSVRVNTLSVPALPEGRVIVGEAGDLLEGAPEQFSRLAKQPKFITLSHHLNDGFVVVASLKSWDRLGPMRQEQLRTAFNAMRQAAYSKFQYDEERLRQDPPPGTAVLAWTPEDRRQWREQSHSLDIASSKVGAASLQAVQGYPVLQLVSGEAPAARISWNAWMEDDQGATSRAVTVGKVASLRLDLARQPFMRRLSAPPDDRFAAQLAKLTSGQTLTVYVQPILLTPHLTVAPGSGLPPKTMKLIGANVKSDPDDWTKVQAFWDEKMPVQEISKALSLGTALQWNVKGAEAGCARVAFVVWDEARTIPLDNLVISVPAEDAGGTKTTCYGTANASDMSGGLETLLGDPRSTTTKADVALHVFEFDEEGGDSQSVAVLVHKKRLETARDDPAQTDSGVYAWTLASVLSAYVSGGLSQAVAQAHVNVSNHLPTPFADVVDGIERVVFGGRSANDVRTASMAKEALRDATARSNPARIFMRLIDKKGQQVYLPLGLLAAETSKPVVARRFAVVQTLAGPGAREPSCIGSWYVGRSRLLASVEGDTLKALESAPLQLQAPAQLLSTHEAVAAYVGGQPSVREGEGFLALAHHEAGGLRFAKGGRNPESIRSAYINRQFPPGSFAFLSACSTSGTGEQTSEIVNRLAAKGVSTLISSPFPVDLNYGVLLELAFERQVLNEAGKPSGATVADLFERSVRDVAEGFPKLSAIAEMGLEFQLAGNPDLKVCAPR